MKKLLYIFILFAVSCSNDKQPELITPSDKVEAKIVTDPDSRAAVNGTSFAKGSNVGVFLYKSDGVTPHTTDVNLNIRTVYASFKNEDDNEFNEWVYYFNYALSVFHSCITLDKKDGDVKCYAYYPQTYSGTDPKAIPITMSSQYDLMYAKNEEIKMPKDPLDTDVNIDLNFEHALSCINFNFHLQNVNQDIVRLEGVRFNADQDIMTEGTLNIKEETPTLTVTKKANTFSTSWYSSSFVIITDNLTYGVLVPPTSKAVAYTVFLTINGIDMQTPIEIPANIYEAGKSYTVNITIGNYAKFDSISIDEEWVKSDPENEDTHLDHTI